MNKWLLTKWILANGTGMALGFYTYLYLLMVIAFGLDFEKYWSDAAVEGLENSEQMLRWGSAIGLPLAGVVFTSFQAVLLRGSSVNLRRWIFAGPSGFVVPLLVIWALTSVWGDIPGPVEPFTIVGGGLLGVAAIQWWSLPHDGGHSKRWLLLWCFGLPLGMVAFMLTYALLDAVIVPSSAGSITWAWEIGLIGFSVGSVAAAVSGTSLLRSISVGTPVASMETPVAG
jgi:hypothetical protein